MSLNARKAFNKIRGSCPNCEKVRWKICVGTVVTFSFFAANYMPNSIVYTKKIIKVFSCLYFILSENYSCNRKSFIIIFEYYAPIFYTID